LGEEEEDNDRTAKAPCCRETATWTLSAHLLAGSLPRRDAVAAIVDAIDRAAGKMRK